MKTQFEALQNEAEKIKSSSDSADGIDITDAADGVSRGDPGGSDGLGDDGGGGGGGGGGGKGFGLSCSAKISRYVAIKVEISSTP